jgi:hypothetical protein
MSRPRRLSFKADYARAPMPLRAIDPVQSR